MKEVNNIRVIGIDLGYDSVKTASSITPTGLSVYPDNPLFERTSYILECGGVRYRVGDGGKPFVKDKTADDDFYLLTLAAIAKELNRAGLRTADVYLSAGLPAAWFQEQRQAFYEYLTREKDVAFLFNGEKYRIHIVGCELHPQVCAAAFGHTCNFQGACMLADIGGSLMDLALFRDAVPVEDCCATLELGVRHCVSAAQEEVRQKLNAELDMETVLRILRGQTSGISGEYLELVEKARKEYVRELLRALCEHSYNPGIMRLFLTGGGALLTRDLWPGISARDDSPVRIAADLHTAACGYENIAAKNLESGSGSCALRTLNVLFDLNDDTQRDAWERLQRTPRESRNRVVLTALLGENERFRLRSGD